MKLWKKLALTEWSVKGLIAELEALEDRYVAQSSRLEIAEAKLRAYERLLLQYARSRSDKGVIG